MDDTEVMFLRALLQHSEIPFYIIGENFGSLYPGIQVASYNERRFVVAAEYLEDAQALLIGHRNLYEPSFVNLPVKSRIRIVVEALTFGWCFPSGSKKNHQQE